MARSKSLWLLQCLGFCLLGGILHGIVSQSVTPLLSWAIYHNDPASPLRRNFAVRNFLPLCAFYGFALGLIPLHRIRELLRSYFGNLITGTPKTYNEQDWRRPILWAWLPVAIPFLIHFIFWQPPDHTVLATTASQGRLDYFFSSPIATMNLWTYREGAYIFDRIVLTGLTIFLLAYSFGVWFRHQFPSLPDVDDPAI
jgi:hypothetical protein